LYERLVRAVWNNPKSSHMFVFRWPGALSRRGRQARVSLRYARAFPKCRPN
jgi:hypothetical protein